MVKNSAFVFIKPHAVTDKVIALVKDELTKRGITITKEGDISGTEIDEKKLIDQHYYAIASKATLLQPSELNIPEEKFKAKFGVAWKDALAKGQCYNALGACEKLDLDADGLDALWGKTKKAGKMIKFGGGFYCGEVEPNMYVFNGFFMSMRSKFVGPDVSIHYFTVEFDAKDLSWEDFRGSVLGPTDPETAPADSLRGMILNDYEALGLKSKPNVGDNGVHASASPFEALAERMNWLQAPLASDPFGAAMIKAGISPETIHAWSVDPQVTYGPTGIKGSLFDTFEDTNADYNLALAQMVAGVSSASSAAGKKPMRIQTVVQSDTLTLAIAFAAGVIAANVFRKITIA